MRNRTKNRNSDAAPTSRPASASQPEQGDSRSKAVQEHVPKPTLISPPILETDFGELKDHSSKTTHRQSTGRSHVPRPENEVIPCATESSKPIGTPKFAESSPYCSSRDSSIGIRDECNAHVIVTGAFPPCLLEPGVHIETIRDPANPSRLVFLRWEYEHPAIFHSIECEGRSYVPPEHRPHK